MLLPIALFFVPINKCTLIYKVNIITTNPIKTTITDNNKHKPT